MEPRPFEIVGKRSPAIVQPFDDLASANEAVERLVFVDISLTKIELLTKPDAIAFAANEENGFWQSLRHCFSRTTTGPRSCETCVTEVICLFSAIWNSVKI